MEITLVAGKFHINTTHIVFPIQALVLRKNLFTKLIYIQQTDSRVVYHKCWFLSCMVVLEYIKSHFQFQLTMLYHFQTEH